jgi:hypothetical protein
MFVGIHGLQQFLDSDTAWRFKFPTTLIDLECDPPPGLSARPNVFFFGDSKSVISRLKQFAFFKPLIFLQTSINHQVIKIFKWCFHSMLLLGFCRHHITTGSLPILQIGILSVAT